MITKKILFTMLILLLVSLVAAINVSTDKTDYSSGEIVTANISSCVGTSITKFINPNGDLADIKGGQDNWAATYHTSSDSTAGKYTVSASCSNGLAQAKFCVDDPGCLAEACTPDWDCGDWSSCGADQSEKRICTDKNNCELDKEETQSCIYTCQESWTCPLGWSTCQNGIQTRVCYDQNNCGTTLSKPSAQQACQEQVYQPVIAPPKPVVKEESFFAKNKGLIIAVVLAAALLALGLLYFWRWKEKEAGFEEVREWMRSEREQGVSDENISAALKKRGWEDKDITAAFKRLK